jgi:hypothetical protein
LKSRPQGQENKAGEVENVSRAKHAGDQSCGHSTAACAAPLCSTLHVSSRDVRFDVWRGRELAAPEQPAPQQNKHAAWRVPAAAAAVEAAFVRCVRMRGPGKKYVTFFESVLQ